MPVNSRNILYSHLAFGNESGRIYEEGGFNGDALGRTIAAARVMAGRGDTFATSFLAMLQRVEGHMQGGDLTAAYETLAPYLAVARETVTSNLPEAAPGLAQGVRPHIQIGGPNGERC